MKRLTKRLEYYWNVFVYLLILILLFMFAVSTGDIEAYDANKEKGS